MFDGDVVLPTPFLDISSRISPLNELGLHGLAFDPDFENNGYFYITYTDAQLVSVLSRWTVSADPNVADAGSEVIVLSIQQPQEWHNASQLQFGPDGYLYVGAGDGGFSGDPDDRAQDLGQLFGKSLRLDVSGALPYEIPADNPFVGVAGALPEIWAYGLRNPWRFSFDRVTGDLFIADVGQGDWEEVDIQPAGSLGGENYGWRLMEGPECFNPPGACDDGSLTLPALSYSHSFGCAITGGFSYRGANFPRFQGRYFYGDWCSGLIWMADQDGPDWQSEILVNTDYAVVTFGEDEAGELYLADQNDGTIYQLIDTEPFCDVEMDAASYTEGEIATASSARLVNLGTTPASVRLQVLCSLRASRRP